MESVGGKASRNTGILHFVQDDPHKGVVVFEITVKPPTNSRSPAGMTTRKTRAKTKATAKAL